MSINSQVPNACDIMKILERGWEILNTFNRRDLFNAYFAKTSNIYKYMGENKYWPFLHRNLRYMEGRCKRNNKVRDCISVDEICQKLYDKKDPSLIRRKGQSNKQSNLQTSSQRQTTNETKENNIRKIIKEEHADDTPISYNFIVDHTIAQETRCDKMICPWCLISAPTIKALMTHHKTFHMRFSMNLVETAEGHRIDVRVNPRYDGSYEGFKYPGHNMHGDFRFSSKTPQKKQPGPRICFNARNKLFQARARNLYEANSDFDGCSGRLYYHTSTCLPIKPNEIDLDSEADNDPDWLLEKTRLMIDEFSDVNEGEKEIMKMWNIHIMTNYKHRGDSMIRVACFDFVEKYGDEVLAKNLFRNFTLHLANLWDFGIINSKDILTTVRRLKEKIGKVPQNGKSLSNHC